MYVIYLTNFIRAGFSWWEAWGPVSLGVYRWETVKALGLKLQDIAQSSISYNELLTDITRKPRA